MSKTVIRKHTPKEGPKHLPTNQFADIFGVRPDTVRRNLCTKGHFMGVVPLKLPNGRLLWPEVRPEEVAR